MPLDQRMGKENVVHLHNGIQNSRKNNNILNFAVKWMELENIILGEVTQTQERQLSHVLTHKWFLNINQRKPAYKPQSQRT